MSGKNNRRVMRRRSKTADSKPLAFELLQTCDRGSCEDDLIVLCFDRRDQDEIEACQVGLNHGPDIDDWRVSACECLGRKLTAPQENRLNIESVFFEDSFLLGDPNVAL